MKLSKSNHHGSVGALSLDYSGVRMKRGYGESVDVCADCSRSLMKSSAAGNCGTSRWICLSPGELYVRAAAEIR